MLEEEEVEEVGEVASYSTHVQEGRQVSGTVERSLCVRRWVWVHVCVCVSEVSNEANAVVYLCLPREGRLFALREG